MSSGQKSVSWIWGGERFALLGFAAEKLCQPLENLLKTCRCLFTTVFAQSTLTNAMNLIYFNAVRELADISPFQVISEINKYAVTAHIAQWKGDQFLMV